MAKKAENKSSEFDIGLELAFQAGALGLVTVLSATALAPVLPQDVKQKINQALGGDLDASHHYLKDKLMIVAAQVEKAANRLHNGAQEPQRSIRKSATDNKCQEQTVEIGKWVFTIPSLNCV